MNELEARATFTAMTDEEADYLLDTGIEEIQRALALNPSCPICHLHSLADDYPREVLRNPLLPLLALENPAEWHKLIDQVGYGLFLEYKRRRHLNQ